MARKKTDKAPEPAPPEAGQAAPAPEVSVEEAQAAPQEAQPGADQTQISVSRGFGNWLTRSRAFTSYQTGQLFLVGRLPNGQVSFHQQNYVRAMGVHATPQRLYVGSLFQIWRLENVLAPHERANENFDRLYVPRNAQTTGDVDVHELGVDRAGRVVFVNTKFSCLATLSINLLDSGRGMLARVDPKSGAKTDLAFCPGFLRGLALHNGFAIVTVSLPRDGAFSGLALQDELKKRDGEPWCGICIIDLRSGDLVEWIRLDGAIKELFDVAAIPDVACPMALGVHSPDIQSLISFDPEFGLLAPPAAQG
jgi:hypothetical protein